MITRKQKISQLPVLTVIKDTAKIVVVQDGSTYAAEVKTYFARSVYEKRHAYVNDTSYCGQAPLGSAENLPYWIITKIVISSNGSVTVTRATNVTWTNYLTHNYS